MVIVTCEAMKATATPPVKSLYRLVCYAELYRDLAVAAIERSEAMENKVWVTTASVRAYAGRNWVSMPTLWIYGLDGNLTAVPISAIQLVDEDFIPYHDA